MLLSLSSYCLCKVITITHTEEEQNVEQQTIETRHIVEEEVIELPTAKIGVVEDIIEESFTDTPAGIIVTSSYADENKPRI